MELRQLNEISADVTRRRPPWGLEAREREMRLLSFPRLKRRRCVACLRSTCARKRRLPSPFLSPCSVFATYRRLCSNCSRQTVRFYYFPVSPFPCRLLLYRRLFICHHWIALLQRRVRALPAFGVRSQQRPPLIINTTSSQPSHTNVSPRFFCFSLALFSLRGRD